MKDTVTIEDSLIGATAINRMLTKSNRDKVTSARLELIMRQLGVNPIGKDGRGNLLWSSIAVTAIIPGIKKVLDLEKPDSCVVEKSVKPPVDYTNLIADMDHRVSLILSDVLDETVEKIAQMHLGNQTIYKTLVEKDKKRQAEHEAVIRSLMDVSNGLAAILGKLNEPVVEKKPEVIARPVIVETQEQTPKPKQKHRPHIDIVGITPPVTTTIDKEFGETFKISYLGPNETNKIQQLRNCDRVFTLRGKVMSRHLDQLKMINQKPFAVGDSLSKIRDALTSFYVEYEEIAKEIA